MAREEGISPVEISFTGTLRILQTRPAGVPEGAAGRQRWWEEVKEAIGGQRLQERRERSCPREKKVTWAVWPVKRKEDEERFIPTLVVVPQFIP